MRRSAQRGTRARTDDCDRPPEKILHRGRNIVCRQRIDLDDALFSIELEPLMLEARGQQLGVAGSMIFHNRFVSQDELTEFLSATDIYITPYLQPELITSGTLAYAVGAGKAVISTPYIYARELLGDGRGVLVLWRDSHAIAQEVIALVSDDSRRRAMCTRAAAHGLE